jgi:hypothetical protein
MAEYNLENLWKSVRRKCCPAETLLHKGNIIQEEFMVGGGDFGCKLRFNVVSIVGEFISMMWEGKTNGL